MKDLQEGLLLLPKHCRESMRLYIEAGIRPGSFMTAILSDNFMSACAFSDEINQSRLFDYANFLYNYAPSACFGSSEKVEAWIASRGVNGQRAEESAP